jgi:pimeloyl-ACP methyl ester carboxylesterase
MGGWIAMRLAADYPHLVSALVLEDSAGISDSGDEDLMDKVNATGVPVLIIWGREDKILPVTAGKYLNSKIKSSTLIVLEKTGHVPHWEAPDVYDELVMGFIQNQKEPQSRSGKSRQ